MNYKQIIGQVGLNLGWDGFDNKYVNNVKFAVKYAELHLAGDSGTIKKELQIPIKSTQNKYGLPGDIEYPRGVFILGDNETIELTMVEYNDLMRYVIEKPEELSAMYKNQNLYAYNKVSSGSEIVVYPAVDGILYITYDAVLNDSTDFDIESQPLIHKRFHIYIVDGATYYLVKQEMAKIAQKDNPDMLNTYLAMVNSYKKNFDEGIQKYTSFSNYRPGTPIVKPFNFYDNGEEYI